MSQGGENNQGGRGGGEWEMGPLLDGSESRISERYDQPNSAYFPIYKSGWRMSVTTRNPLL